MSFGRYANSGELNYWRQNLGNKNVSQMVSNHRSYISSNQSEREQTVRRSYMDAFGWQPSADELRYWSAQKKTYAELMANHVNNWLNVYPDKKQHVIKQSYYKVFGRTANANELKYWMSQPTYPYVQLVATHTTWKLKNQSSSSITGVRPNINNQNGISTASLSPGAAAQVIAAGGANVIAPGGGNVVSGGGANVVSGGGAN
ncbi:MAG: hypothetical protein EOP51_20440 [Sphingobacteriales bacterium]|nr:MAG: hypothetical protein EOP51_20440 [Sphingobacteriales bacterium]